MAHQKVNAGVGFLIFIVVLIVTDGALFSADLTDKLNLKYK